MGNSNQANNQNLNQNLFEPKDFEQKEILTDSRYGKATILKEKLTQQLYAQIQNTLTEQAQWNAQLQEAFFRKQLSHANIVKLLNYNSQKSTDFCSSFFKINFLYEYLNINLKNEILERQKIHYNYQEGELWYLLDSLISAAFYLKTKAVFHGDIRPYNVLLTNNGQVKLGDQFSATKKMPAVAQIQIGASQDFYLSPQHLQTINKVSTNVSLDNWKGDVFSIAATVLEAATLESFSETCYSKQDYALNQSQVNNLLQKTRISYSERLFIILQKMLSESEAQRPSFDELVQELNNDEYVKVRKTENIQIIKVVQSQNTVNNAVQNHQDFNISDEEMDRRIEAALKMSRDAVARYNNSPAYISQQIKNDNTTIQYQTVQDEVKRSKKQSEEVAYQQYNPPLTNTYQVPSTNYQTVLTTSYQPLTEYQPISYVSQQAVINTNVQQSNPLFLNNNVDKYAYNSNYNVQTPISYPVVEQEVVKRSGNIKNSQTGPLNDYVPLTFGKQENITSYQPLDQVQTSYINNNIANNLVGGNNIVYQEVRNSKYGNQQDTPGVYANPEEFNNGNQQLNQYSIKEYKDIQQ
ncbi:protein kinase domain protein [Ichthyophthirius multifiliis]|uniref:Protein kinase domain protein n=1 Tax=Ichthyophthirius multifiliis TaxID=5932 RepID=G0R3B3_ICHMU|nr:protein kinase domain protein [Ichthyophthirius multifiliis]EGR28032.1 protein kinase domain protein [Ichthyophthirius multifiliis]|eukprot:XP_004027377.1 protein kinase domain protein [Ichthyophthirius multifiliis]